MKRWDFWFPELLVHAPGAPDPTVEHAVSRAAREFLRRTRAWTEWLDPATSAAGLAQELEFDLPTRAEVVRVERATRNGSPLEVRSYRESAADWTRSASDEPGVVSRDLRVLTLTGDWTAGDTVQVQVSLMPAPHADGIPDELAERYLEPIAEGAKSRLLLTVKTPFYDQAEGRAAAARFDAAIGAHAVDAWRGHTNNVPRARPRWC